MHVLEALPGSLEVRARTKDDEAGVRVGGAQGVLGGAAVHGSVELGWDSLQNQLLPLPLGAAIQQASPHPSPGEERLWKDFVLSTVQIHEDAEKNKEKTKQVREVGLLSPSISESRRTDGHDSDQHCSCCLVHDQLSLG